MSDSDLPDPSSDPGGFWEAVAGPFLDLAGVLTVTGLDEARVQAMAARRELLALPCRDGTVVYPLRQFTDQGSVLPGLAEVLAGFDRGGVDPWTWALWLGAQVDEWEGMSAWEWLTAGRDPAPVIAEARRDGARWAT